MLLQSGKMIRENIVWSTTAYHPKFAVGFDSKSQYQLSAQNTNGVQNAHLLKKKPQEEREK